MRTVHEVSNLTGVSIRTLHHYDAIGLLHPTSVTEAGYRLYDDAALERLQHILLFRELEFPLKDIKEILDSSNFERNKALEQQIQLLQLKKEHIENLITFARGIQGIGVRNMDFSAFDAKKIDEYTAQAKAAWGKTDAFREYEERAKNVSDAEKEQLGEQMMALIAEFGPLRNLEPDSSEVQEQVKKLQDFITEHFYTCTTKIFAGLGKMYNGGGKITENIDATAGEGTAEFISKAIAIYCK